jgi:hypothetical protein
MAHMFSQFLSVEPLTASEKMLLTSSTMILLKYNDKTGADGKCKLRPICLRDCISKVLWGHLLRTITDERCHLTSSSFGRRGGCASVARAIQAVLDDGKGVLHLDAANAFNACSRHTAFAYIQSRGPTYYDAFPFINLFYASVSSAFLFGLDGKPTFHQVQTTGASQGCSSGPWLFHCSIVEVLRACSSKLLNVADDMFYITSGKAEDRIVFDDMLQKFGQTGLSLLGSKTALFANKAILKQIKYMADIMVPPLTPSCSPQHVLGTVVVPDQRSNRPISGSVIDKCLSKFLEAVKTIMELDASSFIKYQCLRLSQSKVIYLLSSISDCLSEIVANRVMSTVKSSFIKICNLAREGEPITHEFLIFTPTEEHGCGFLPFVDLLPAIRSNSGTNAIEMINGLGVRHQITPAGSDSNGQLRSLWKRTVHIFKKNNNLPLEAQSTHASWLDTWPTFYGRKISDVDFSFAISVLLRRLPSCSYTCFTKARGKFVFAEHSAEARYSHFFACVSCGACQFHRRHESVLHAIGLTAKYHALQCELNPKGCPVPGKSKGGPDFFIPGVVTLVGDVRVTYHRLMRACFENKMRQYNAFSSAMNGATLPFVVNTNGSIYDKTIKILHQHLGKTQFTLDLLTNAQFALFKGMAQGYWSLNVRAQCSESDLMIEDDLMLEDEKLSSEDSTRELGSDDDGS